MAQEEHLEEREKHDTMEDAEEWLLQVEENHHQKVYDPEMATLDFWKQEDMARRANP